MRHLPNGQTVPLLPSPVQMTSVISVSFLKNGKFNFSKAFLLLILDGCHCVQLARPVTTVPNVPGIPGPPVGGGSSGSSSPSGYSLHSETKMVR